MILSGEEVEVHRVMNAALGCLQMDAERRATMAQVDIKFTESLRTEWNENTCRGLGMS
jgi:hypothetical protein